MTSLFASLRFRLLLLVLIIAVPAIILLLYTSESEREFHTRQIWQTVRLTSDISAGNLGQVVQGAQQVMSAVAEMPSVRRLEREPTSAILSRVRAANPQYDNIGLVDLDGEVVASAMMRSITGTLSVADRGWFKQVKATARFAVGEVVVGRLTGKRTVQVAHPVFDDEGRLSGVLSASMNLDWLARFLATTDLPKGSGHVVIDANGVVAARYPDHELWSGFDGSQVPIVTEVLARRSGTAQLAGLDGGERLFGFRPVPGTEEHLFVFVGIPRGVAFAEADALLLRNLVLLIAVTLLALLFAWFAATAFVVGPVRSMVDAAGRLSSGDLSARSGLEAGHGELNKLAAAFDSMAETLERRRDETQRAAAEVRALNDDLERRVVLRTAELEEANRELQGFTYSVSHDLRTPLRAMNCFAQLLLEDYHDRIDEEAARRLTIISDNAARMARLIDDLLDLARLSRAELTPTQVNMVHLAHVAWSDVRPSEPDYPAEFSVGDLPDARGDYSLLRNVFANLLSNAVKFSRPTGHARVEVGGRIENGEAVYYVRDHGVGFDMAYAHKVFGVFQRLHGIDEFEGNGVGLALVQRIVARHGGRVWAESAPGEGATFFFALPALPILLPVPAAILV